MQLTPQHREILTAIGEKGATAERLRRYGREFGELSAQRMIVFWPEGRQRPLGVYGPGTAPGRWYLTHEGADAIGLEPLALRLA
jgi:hypothetical protein